MTDRLSTLLTAIVSYVTQHDGYITKTKLLKLLYLLDVEFYRTHGVIFTGFRWKYFHLGPWTAEFDPLFDELISCGDLVERSIDRGDHDTKLLRASEVIDLRKPFDTYKDEAILKTVLDVWGPRPTGEILDYVYFRTEPMERGIRNESLDFSTIVRELPETYKRIASDVAAGKILKRRRDFAKKIAARRAAPVAEFTKPRYDEEFHAAMEKLDTSDL